MMGQIASPRALSEKYYMYLWAEQVLNLSLQTSHAFIRDDLRGEIAVSHSRFNNPIWSGLDQAERREYPFAADMFYIECEISGQVTSLF